MEEITSSADQEFKDSIKPEKRKVEMVRVEKGPDYWLEIRVNGKCVSEKFNTQGQAEEAYTRLLKQYASEGLPESAVVIKSEEI